MSSTDFKTVICTFLGSIGGVILNLLGGGDSLLLALVIFMLIDFVTGVLVAAIWGNSNKADNGRLSSEACWKGILKKIGTLLIVVVATQIDIITGINYVRNAVVVAFCVSEIISICENAGQMGILPKSVQKILNKAIDLLNEKTNIKDEGVPKDDNDTDKE